MTLSFIIMLMLFASQFYLSAAQSNDSLPSISSLIKEVKLVSHSRMHNH